MLEMTSDLFIGLACGFLGGATATAVWTWYERDEDREFLRAELAMTKERLAQYVKASQARSAAATQDLRECVRIAELRRQIHARMASLMSAS